MEPYLYTHLVTPSPPDKKPVPVVVYDISGKFSPISIKDQIMRASLLVERAFEQEIITPKPAPGDTSPNRPLLVIGSGFAGIAACYHAVKRGVQVVLVENEDYPLKKFELSRDRWISPTEYDWPSRHWRHGRFPIEDCDCAFVKIEALEISGLLRSFKKGYLDKLLKNKDLFYPVLNNSVKIELPNAPAGASPGDNLKKGYFFIKIELSNNSVTLPVDNFGMALACTGFGREQTVIGNYMGVPFWNMIYSPAIIERGNKNILICGSGDGALQDFLYLISGKKSVGDIYEALGLEDKEIESEIFQAEDYSRRCEPYLGIKGTPGRTKRECSTYRKLHKEHTANVIQLLDKYQAELAPKIEALVRPFFDRGNKITVAYRCNHFSSSYAFNRFLVILISTYLEKYAEKEKRVKVLMPEHSVTKIKAKESHQCKYGQLKEKGNKYESLIEAAIDCIGELHTACYVKASCQSVLSGEEKLGDFNQIIVRYGIDAPPFAFGEEFSPPIYNTQILPQRFF